MSGDIPSTPSAFPGYHTPESRSDYQAATRSVRRIRKSCILLFLATVLIIWLVFVPWREKWAGDNVMLLVFWFPCYVLYAALSSFPKRRLERIRTEHRQEMLSLLVQAIRDKTNPQSDWRWLPLCNAGSTLFFTANLMGVINLHTDRILYVSPGDITDCTIESRNLGSTTHTRGSAVTVGGFEGSVLGAYTTGSTTSSTEQHYSHVVDIYTKISGASHLPLYFGNSEAYAKEAYGRVRAMLT